MDRLGWIYYKPDRVKQFPEQQVLPDILPRVEKVVGKFKDLVDSTYSEYNCYRVKVKTYSEVNYLKSLPVTGDARIEAAGTKGLYNVDFYYRNSGTIFFNKIPCISEYRMRHYKIEPCWLPLEALKSQPAGPLLAASKKHPLILDKIKRTSKDTSWGRILTCESPYYNQISQKDTNNYRWVQVKNSDLLYRSFC